MSLNISLGINKDHYLDALSQIERQYEEDIKRIKGKGVDLQKMRIQARTKDLASAQFAQFAMGIQEKLKEVIIKVTEKEVSIKAIECQKKFDALVSQVLDELELTAHKGLHRGLLEAKKAIAQVKILEGELQAVSSSQDKKRYFEMFGLVFPPGIEEEITKRQQEVRKLEKILEKVVTRGQINALVNKIEFLEGLIGELKQETLKLKVLSVKERNRYERYKLLVNKKDEFKLRILEANYKDSVTQFENVLSEIESLEKELKCTLSELDIAEKAFPEQDDKQIEEVGICLEKARTILRQLGDEKHTIQECQLRAFFFLDKMPPLPLDWKNYPEITRLVDSLSSRYSNLKKASKSSERLEIEKNIRSEHYKLNAAIERATRKTS